MAIYLFIFKKKGRFYSFIIRFFIFLFKICDLHFFLIKVVFFLSFFEKKTFFFSKKQEYVYKCSF
jgi:hypothetical protein